jgi:hypothetical protein
MRVNGVSLHLYSGDPPCLEDLAQRIRLDESLTFLTANSAIELFRLDENLRPANQISPKGKALLGFGKAMRLLIPTPILSRTEERVLFRRAIPELGLPPAEADRLRRDAGDWVELLADLEAKGLEPDPGALAEIMLSVEIAELVAQVWMVSRSIQEREGEGRLGFERTVMLWITNGAEGIEHLVMEGFTFLTPIQKALISTVAERAPVDVVAPYRLEQPQLFTQIRQTYADWWQPEPEIWVTDSAGDPALIKLKDSIFSGHNYPLTADPVSVRQYQHLHNEIRECVSKISALLGEGKDPRSIAIVVPNRRDFDAVLQEEANLQSLSVSLGVPPRLLLLTPVGRFILELYQASDGAEVRVSADQFETMLSSGWLGALAQRSVHEFRAVKNQLFARCSTTTEWLSIFSDLASRVPRATEPARQAIDWVDPKHVVVWKDSLERIGLLVERLFEPGERSIGEHVRLLIEALDEIPIAQVLEGEREVIARVKEALQGAVESGSLGIATDEFAEILTSLATEYDEATATEDEALETGKIWVTTPQGIDGVRRDFVFVLGMDATKMPRSGGDDWPFKDLGVSRHLDTERYMFGGVVRAAAAGLRISCSRRSLDKAVIPAPFLLSAGFEIDLAGAPRPTGPSATHGKDFVTPARREMYTISELAIFGLCPHRYKLERLEPRSRRYASPIHVPYLAQGRWIGLVMERLTSRGSIAASMFWEEMTKAAGEVRDQVYGEFPGMSDQDWRSTESHVFSSLRANCNFAIDGGYPIRIEAASIPPHPIERAGRVQFVDMAVRYVIVKGRIAYPFNVDLMHEEWLIPAKTSGLRPMVRDHGLELFPEKASAFAWWAGSIRAAYKANSNPAKFGDGLRPTTRQAERLIDQIEAGKYPRRPGDHCVHCPVLDECLGVDP